MGPRAFNRVCASIRINRDYDVVSVRINAHGVTKRAWAFNCETTVYICVFICAFACRSKLDMHVNTKILIAGNVTCMCASTSQIVRLHIMWP